MLEFEYNPRLDSVHLSRFIYPSAFPLISCLQPGREHIM